MSEGKKSGPPPRKAPVKSESWETSQHPYDKKLREMIDPAAILEKRRFKHLAIPPSLRVVYTLMGQAIATPGNLVAITSAVKTGKSAVVGAMCGASMSTDGEPDLLGFASDNPKGLAVLHFDSEQSPDDHWHCVHRALKRVRRDEPPAWFYSYCLTGLQQDGIMACVNAALVIASEAYGGIHSVLLDGIADLVKDPNDAGECNAFIASLHDLAIEHDCPIIGVIHFNPGSDKTRGHLGSQFERKAETNLRLDKEDGVTEIWSEKQRRAPIPKGSGPCFCWDDAKGMHVSVQNPSDARAEAKSESKLAAMRQDAGMVFAQDKNPSLSHKALVELVAAEFSLKTSGARRRIENWLSNAVVTKEASGSYVLTQ